MTVAILDGDILVYRAAAALQKEIDWGDGKTTSVNPPAVAEAALQTAASWRRLSGCRRAIVAFTGDHNFRRVIMPSYKSNRKLVAKPLAFAYASEAVRGRFTYRLVEGLEADDVMGIMGTSPKYQGAVIVTTDKDLRTVPGLHMNPIKESVPVEITEAQADYAWMMQTLMGDSTDGYGGIPKVGPKTAAKILGAPGEPLEVLWERVWAAYRKAGIGLDEAILQARVARILRFQDYHKENKEISLWHPTEKSVRFSLGISSGASTTGVPAGATT